MDSGNCNLAIETTLGALWPQMAELPDCQITGSCLGSRDFDGEHFGGLRQRWSRLGCIRSICARGYVLHADFSPLEYRQQRTNCLRIQPLSREILNDAQSFA